MPVWQLALVALLASALLLATPCLGSQQPAAASQPAAAVEAGAVEAHDTNCTLIECCTEVDRHHHKKHHHKHKKHPFFTPEFGLFLQERESKARPVPGPQHVNFGALRSWPEVHELLNDDRKLLLMIRHGEAWSNYWQAQLGPDEWYSVVTNCSYTDDDNTTYSIFDALLTPKGEEQARDLNTMLAKQGWYETLVGNHGARAITSPLSRVLDTTLMVLDGLPVEHADVEELCRETLGSDTCDARRSVRDPPDGHPACGPCDYKHGLASAYPKFKFPVLGADKSDLGLLTNEDRLWAPGPAARERQKHQVKRATRFLETVFDSTDHKVVIVMTHSGFIRSTLLAVGREPYRPLNTELVPVLVERRSRDPEARAEPEDGDWLDEEDDVASYLQWA